LRGDTVSSFSTLGFLFGMSGRRDPAGAPPAAGDVFFRRTEHSPVEYARVLGVYEEAAEIRHVRFRLFYGYQDKTEDLGERTLAADLFARRFPRRMETAETAE
jgi:hypothetical protein